VRSKTKRDGFKGKKNLKAMHSDTWDEDEKEDGESEIGPSNEGHSPFCCMAQVNLGDTGEEEEKDFEAIIAKNELTDPIIIEYLRKLHLAKKKVGEPTKVTTQEESPIVKYLGGGLQQYYILVCFNY
jgi:hypothetical protein